MALKKGFLQTNKNIFKLSKPQLFVGILLGISYAFVFYFLLKISRETFRIIGGLLHYNELLILNDKEVHFYNFIYAFIAILFAQSMMIQYWLDKPRTFFSRYNCKRNTIVNDHRLTNWYFIHWFAKMGIMFGLVAINNYTFSIFPTYINF